MDQRRNSILHGVELSHSVALEIGALHRPLLSKSESNVYYVDHCDTDALKAKYANDPNVPKENIVTVDFVVNDGNLRNTVSHIGKFDVVVASHVIEHVPDLVSWLEDIHSLLADDGVLCLAAPDKRFTFDLLRRSTTFKDVKEARDERRWRPSLDTVCDSYRNVTGFNSSQIWDGTFSLENAAIGWPADVVRNVVQRYNDGEYIDVHCWVFTPWELINLIGKIVQDFGIHFDLNFFSTTTTGNEEFYLQLIKRDSRSACSTDWAKEQRTAEELAVWPPGSLEDQLLRLKAEIAAERATTMANRVMLCVRSRLGLS